MTVEDRDPYLHDREHHVYEERWLRFAKIANVIWTITGFIEALIGIRVLLKLIGANPGNAFVNFIYNVTAVLVDPFMGIVTNPQSGGAILEITSLIAMLVYLLIAYGILRLVRLIFQTTEPS